MICFNRKNNLNKVSNLTRVNIIEDIERVEITPKSIFSIFSQLKSRI